MSHFSVAVLHKAGQSIDELLAPYDEDIVCAPYVKYTREEAIAEQRREIEDYKNGLYAEFLKDPEKYKSECNNENHINYLENEFPKRLHWTDEECYQYMKACFEDDEIDLEGNLLSRYNPNSKWDWYTVGGRWSNILVTKSGVKCDENYISEIDLSPDKKAYDKAIRFWEVEVEGKPKKEGEEFFNLYRPEYYTDLYKTKEKYAESQSTFSTFAVITPNGMWYEKGSMGWFGCASNEDGDWESNYKQNFIDTAEPDTMITIVDCHI